jgi:hypothetical protein
MPTKNLCNQALCAFLELLHMHPLLETSHKSLLNPSLGFTREAIYLHQFPAM